MRDVNTVFVSGIFHVLHPGHFRFLKYARNLGERLVVGLLADSLCIGVSVTEDERRQNLEALDFVDEVMLVTGDVNALIALLQPNVVVKGWEFRGTNNRESEIVKSYGGVIRFSPDTMTSSLHDQIETVGHVRSSTIMKPDDFLIRRKINKTRLKSKINNFKKLNVCVLGDLIVDEYVQCRAVGMSREDPTIVVKPEAADTFIGGAGIVAAHARSLGANVTFFSVTGSDEKRQYCLSKVAQSDLSGHVWADDTRPTTVKRRYRSEGKTMLRVNDYASHSISDKLKGEVIEQFERVLPEIDLIVFSDFSYGFLDTQLIEMVLSRARGTGTLIVADSQTSSQLGDLGKFHDLCLVTPTEYEARVTTGDYESGLVTLSNNLRSELNAENVILTLSSDGVLITTSGESDVGTEFDNDSLPALQSAVVDTAGAGDALLIASSMALACGCSIWEASYVGSIASAVQVSRQGNIPLMPADIINVLDQ